MKFGIVKGDITQLEVDAIVNAANSTLLGGGGVDGAIHRAAGKELLVECKTLGDCETGSAKITKGYLLPANYIIHAVGPVWRDGKHQEDTLLAGCYRTCMELANQYQLKSIAFPAISCGIYHFPIDRAAQIAVSEVKKCLAEKTTVKNVYFVAFDDAIVSAYQKQGLSIIEL